MASKVVISYERLEELERILKALRPHVDRNMPVKSKRGERYGKIYLWMKEGEEERGRPGGGLLPTEGRRKRWR